MAIASASNNTSLGILATSMHERAGNGSGKYFAYTSLIAAKSSMFLMNTVVLTTLAIDVPAASKRAVMLLKTLSACAAAPSGITPVAGSTGIIPDVYTIPFTSMACEYGPIAAGAFSVEITFFIAFNPPLFMSPIST